MVADKQRQSIQHIRRLHDHFQISRQSIHRLGFLFRQFEHLARDPFIQIEFQRYMSRLFHHRLAHQ